MTQAAPEAVHGHPSQLQQLHVNLSAINSDLANLEQPIKDLDGLLGEVDKALSTPKNVEKELETAREILSAVQVVAESMSWIPAFGIGEAAGSVSKTLKVVAEKPGGVMADIEDALNEIDATAEPVKAQLRKVKHPTDRVFEAVDKVHGKVAMLVAGTEHLIERYGPCPPQNVERCAGKLNADMDALARKIDHAKDQVTGELQKFRSVLGNVETEFHRFEGYVNLIDKTREELESKAFRNAMHDVRRIQSTADKARKLGERAVEWALGGLKKAGIDVTGAVKFFHGLEARMQSFIHQQIDDVVEDLEDRVKGELEKLPAVQALEEQVGELEGVVDALERRLEAFLQSECVKILEA